MEIFLNYNKKIKILSCSKMICDALSACILFSFGIGALKKLCQVYVKNQVFCNVIVKNLWENDSLMLELL